MPGGGITHPTHALDDLGVLGGSSSGGCEDGAAAAPPPPERGRHARWGNHQRPLQGARPLPAQSVRRFSATACTMGPSAKYGCDCLACWQGPEGRVALPLVRGPWRHA
jgi:hypothetical protein